MSKQPQLSIEKHLWRGPKNELTIRDIIVSRKNQVELAADAVEYALKNMSSVSDRVGDIAENHDLILAGAVENVEKPVAGNNVLETITSRSDMTSDAREKLSKIHLQMPAESAQIIQLRADTVTPGDASNYIDSIAA